MDNTEKLDRILFILETELKEERQINVALRDEISILQRDASISLIPADIFLYISPTTDFTGKSLLPKTKSRQYITPIDKEMNFAITSAITIR